MINSGVISVSGILFRYKINENLKYNSRVCSRNIVKDVKYATLFLQFMFSSCQKFGRPFDLKQINNGYIEDLLHHEINENFNLYLQCHFY